MDLIILQHRKTDGTRPDKGTPYPSVRVFVNDADGGAAMARGRCPRTRCPWAMPRATVTMAVGQFGGRVWGKVTRGDAIVLTHETRWARRPLRRVFGLRRAYVCDSGLKGRFPIAQGAALGLGHPQKLGFKA